MAADDLSTTRQSGDLGAIADGNEARRRANGGVWLKTSSGNASTNEANLMDAYTKARNAGGARRIFIPPEVYDLSASCDAHNLLGLRLTGCGLFSTFNWKTNDNTLPMLKLSHGRHCWFEHFKLTFDQPAYAGIQILRDNVSPSTVTPTLNRMVGLYISGASKVVHGIVIGGTGMVDANNDFNVIEQCDINNYTDSGIVIMGTQSYGNRILNTRLIGDETDSKYAVYTGNAGGCFAMIGGATFGNTLAAFYIGRHYQRYRIQDVVSENDAKFITAPSAAWRKLTVDGNRYSANRINEDKIIMDIDGYCKVRVIDNVFGDGQNPIANLVMKLTNLTAQATVRVIDNEVFTSNEGFFSHQEATTFEGNIAITNEGSVTTAALVA